MAHLNLETVRPLLEQLDGIEATVSHYPTNGAPASGEGELLKGFGQRADVRSGEVGSLSQAASVPGSVQASHWSTNSAMILLRVLVKAHDRPTGNPQGAAGMIEFAFYGRVSIAS